MTVEVRPPAYRILADSLRADITTGRLRPGDRLPAEPQLCARSGVSRSTVREALRLLASQNLIVTTRGVAGGSFVAHPSTEQLSESLAAGVALLVANSVVNLDQLFEMRRILEIPAAALAADRRTPRHLAALDAAFVDPRTASLDEILAAHRTFHLTLAEATGNPLYEMVSRPLYGFANEREVTSSVAREFWVEVNASHREIVVAVADRDVPAAETAARAHLDHLAGSPAG